MYAHIPYYLLGLLSFLSSPMAQLESSEVMASQSCWRDTNCPGLELCVEGSCARAPAWERPCEQAADCGNSEISSCVQGVCKDDVVVFRRGRDICEYVPGTTVYSAVCGHDGSIIGSVDPNFTDEEGFAFCKKKTLERCGEKDGTCTPETEAHCQKLVDLELPFDRMCYDSEATEEHEIGICCWRYVNDPRAPKRDTCFLSSPRPETCEEFQALVEVCSPLPCDDESSSDDCNETQTTGEETTGEETTGEETMSETNDATSESSQDSTLADQHGQGGGCAAAGGPQFEKTLWMGFALGFVSVMRRRRLRKHTGADLIVASSA